MTFADTIPLPVKFNPFKHHWRFFTHYTHKRPLAEVIKSLDAVCNNYIDFYTGLLSPPEVCNQVVNLLKQARHFQMNSFEQWLAEVKYYRVLSMSDESQWIVRRGEEEERYIHIHPARTGPHTIRIKGSTLKTVVMMRQFINIHGDELNLEVVNAARRQIGLSPVKSLHRHKGFMKCYDMMFTTRAF